MIDTKNLQSLLKKDMTRKEFLQAIGAAIVGVIGLTAFLKNIDKFAQHQTNDKVAKTGYGSSPYGR
jgi:hypothetical protein